MDAWPPHKLSEGPKLFAVVGASRLVVMSLYRLVCRSPRRPTDHRARSLKSPSSCPYRAALRERYSLEMTARELSFCVASKGSSYTAALVSVRDSRSSKA